MPILAAIANHEETEGTAVSPISAAVILAGQVRRAPQPGAQVRASSSFDIHDRVNYAVEQSFLRVDSDARTVSLELTIDTRISQVMEYFEIFLGRMQMCRHAAELPRRALPSGHQRGRAGVKRTRGLWVSIIFVLHRRGRIAWSGSSSGALQPILGLDLQGGVSVILPPRRHPRRRDGTGPHEHPQPRGRVRRR